MDDVDFPMEEAVDIKQETDDYDLPDNCLEVGSFCSIYCQETHCTVPEDKYDNPSK